MAGRKCVKSSKYVAKLADTRAPCAFCRRNVDEETTYGKLYSIGDIHCHYYCVLLSCCLIQKGKDEEGLFGFMYPDILAEIERSKKHRCSYCGVEGATLGCSITQCKKQFHLPCGREKKAVSLYFGNYKSFCEKHAPKQKIPDVIMSKAKSRLARIRKSNRDKSKKTECMEEPESVCVICYEAVDGFPTTETFWPPCCARDAWFHRSCLQRMALSAGVYYLKCPLCNDKDAFYSAVLQQGYFIPDRDAAWELEQNAFSEIYERPVECRALECKCSKGRNFDEESGMWDIKLCVLCGGPGSHQACLNTELFVCAVCSPAAPDHTHLAAIDAVSLPSHDLNTQRMPSGPVMPSRMSLRRTKPRPLYTPSSSSQNVPVKTEIETNAVKSNTDLSREELNLKTPRRSTANNIPTEQNLVDKSLTPLKLLKQPENELLSPLKLLKQGLNGKISSTEVEQIILDRKIIEEMREKFKKPKPASVKRKIVGEILEGLLNYVNSEQNVELKKSPEKIQEFPEDATKYEDKENVLDLPMKLASNILNENLPLQSDISKTPDIISESSKQNDSNLQEQNILISINQVSDLSEPLEENILQPSILEQLIVCENANLTPKKVILEDDSSNNSSPFQLPPEFIAESSNSLPIIDTPKKLKKINIENDSMEISENNQIVNIDLVKIDSSSLMDFKIPEEKCALKLSPLNKDIIKKNLDIDLESFKNQYLNEVDRKFNCKFNHNHENLENNPKTLRTALDFAVEAVKKPPKRKLPASNNVVSKKRKTTNKVRKTKKQHNDRTDDSVCNQNVAGEKSNFKNVSDEKRKYKKLKDVKNRDKSDNNECKAEKSRRKKLKCKNNNNTELSIRNKNINLKIRFKSKELNLKISKPKKKDKKSKNDTPKVLKQYVLQYPINNTSPQDCIARPDADVTPKKRKYIVKCEKSSDNLKQTSIASYFKISPKT